VLALVAVVCALLRAARGVRVVRYVGVARSLVVSKVDALVVSKV
jgi:hypothetical protein